MKRALLRTTSSGTTTTSRPGHLVCPVCVFGELQPQAHGLASCAACDCLFSGVVLKVLAQVAALPEAQGKHACEECHHPEMRLLPDGVFHCPACGSEVLPVVMGPISGVSKERNHRCIAKQATSEGGVIGRRGAIKVSTSCVNNGSIEEKT
jgi:ribosomal protein L37AE/L43A